MAAVDMVDVVGNCLGVLIVFLFVFQGAVSNAMLKIFDALSKNNLLPSNVNSLIDGCTCE